ncbi:hypothetical protein AMECASPLE_023730 [Ameca splendens]|uniref:Uncharacterized protein n=1 Tax=Ameca splendens TaxID=208324 RepID=A0ABV0ZDE6_9TELE
MIRHDSTAWWIISRSERELKNLSRNVQIYLSLMEQMANRVAEADAQGQGSLRDGVHPGQLQQSSTETAAQSRRLIKSESNLRIHPAVLPLFLLSRKPFC